MSNQNFLKSVYHLWNDKNQLLFDLQTVITFECDVYVVFCNTLLQYFSQYKTQAEGIRAHQTAKSTARLYRTAYRFSHLPIGHKITGKFKMVEACIAPAVN